MNFPFEAPAAWWLEISRDVMTAAWQQSQRQVTANSQWTAYLNQLCLDVFLPWMQTEPGLAATSWLSPTELPTVWEFVNGTAIDTSTARLVLVPSEAIDSSELEVPQEWVDIPSWVADYYLAVQIKIDNQPDSQIDNQPDSQIDNQLDNGWLRVWGYTTHQKLKDSGNYDSTSRSYCIDAEDLAQDMDALWVTSEFCAREQLRVPIAPLTELSTVQVENLSQRLASPAVAAPRLAIPFTMWSALLERGEWRQRLYQARMQQAGISPIHVPANVPARLSLWLQNQFEVGWRSVEMLLQPQSGQLAANLRSHSALSSSLRDSETSQVKLIDLNTDPEQQVILLVALTSETDDRVGITVQVHAGNENTDLPPALTLSLLADTGEVLQSVQSQLQDNYIQLRFRCPLDTEFALQVASGDFRVTEYFIA